MTQEIALTYWPDRFGETKSEMVLPWAKVPDLIRQAGNKRVKKYCPLVKFATFGDIRAEPKEPGKLGCLRNDLNVISITALEGDYDAGEVSPAEAIERLKQHNIRAYVVTTFTHTADKPRWRVFTPLSRPYDPPARKRFAEILNGAVGGILAKESDVLSQSYFIGWPIGVEPEILTTFDDPEEGYCLDDISHADEIRKPFVGKTQPAKEGEGESKGDAFLGLLAGDIHGNALRLAGKLAYDGYDAKLIQKTFEGLKPDIIKARGPERAAEFFGGELQRIIESAVDKYAPPPPVDPSIILANARAKQLAPPATFTADALMDMEFPDLKWCVPDILPEGTYLLSAKPKVGKSWLALQIALAIATEGITLGKRVQGGSALVLALEDNQRRLKSRLQLLGAFCLPNKEHLKRLHLETDWSRSLEGGTVAIEKWIKATPDARLVVIDTLAKFRPSTGGRASAYEQDYAALEPIKALSDKYNITILIITHNRKMESNDPLELISGTLGLSGGCDGALVLDRTPGTLQATLHLIGRDIENDGAFAIRFRKDNCHWEMLGGAEEVTASSERAKLLSLFKEEKRGMGPKEVAELSGRKPPTVRRLLREMIKAGNLDQGMGKLYYLKGQAPEEAEQGEHPEQGEQGEQGEQLD